MDWPFGKDHSEGATTDGPEEEDDSSDIEGMWTSIYASLPWCGIPYYSVPDAALVLALDLHWSGASGLPVVGDAVDDEDPRLHAELEPLASKLAHSLMKAIVAGETDAEVRRRELDTGHPVPQFTFVTLPEVQEWARMRGLQAHGSYLSRHIMRTPDRYWTTAAETARDRFDFRHPDDIPNPGTAESGQDQETLSAENARLRRDLRVERLRNRSLQAGAIDPTASELTPQAMKQRKTLLMVIGVLCVKAGVDVAGQDAVKQVFNLITVSGLRISESTVRGLVSDIRPAMEARKAI
jgi:hypothetical protein